MSATNGVLHLSFNNDRSCFAVGTENGFRLFNMAPLAQLCKQDIPNCGGIGQVFMLKRTNLLAIVGNGKHMKYPKNKVFIWDASSKTAVLEFTFGSPVLNVRLTANMIIVALKNRVYGYGFPSNTDKLFEYNTRDNEKGLLEISHMSNENQWCVIPGSKRGSIQLVDINIKHLGTSSIPSIINAHQHDIACVALNQHGTLVATASAKGTLIRVFDIKTKRQTIELRRGADPANLYCINFSADSAFLCASSDKGSVHIFALKDPSKNKRSTFSKVGLFGQYTESQWGLAKISVQAECPCICAFGPGSSIFAMSYNGSFNKYVFTSDGNCNREAYDVFLDMQGDEEDVWH